MHENHEISIQRVDLMELPKRYKPSEAEEKWIDYWINQKIFKFDEDSKNPVFSIDTPPPTVSGKIHLGHAFSYSHTDFIARYKRMRGFNVFYPFGTDDNGLATERLIEKMKKVKATNMGRDDFRKLCLKTLEKELRPSIIKDSKNLGLSCDWNIFYTTLSDYTFRISQAAFLDLVKKKRVYQKEAPVIWDPVLQTALSQVELVDKEVESTFNDIAFKTDDGKEIIIATTRPELLSSCVAVFIHPDDKKNKNLVGKELIVPYYHFKVPVLEDKRVDLEKGSGVVMCCTFGDQTDIEWYKAFNLPLKEGIGKNGKMTSIAGDLEGMFVRDARAKIIEEMKKSGELKRQENIIHTVNVGERSGTEIELIHSKQWFLKYLDLKDDFLKRGRELNWFPDHMRNRLENWINGLQWDWCISRQRYSGVPFPVWFDKKTGEPIFASEDQLPVDPLKDLPKGYKKEDVIPEKDVLDTWATSSLTPHLAVDRYKGKPIYKRLYPMTLRPQAHDIISFWLFNTLARGHIHDNALPWKDAMISGWALDPKGKKMSKSKGNNIEPQDLIKKYGADAVRYWAGSSKLGDDVPYQEKDVQTGKKTVTKIWNASKFTIMNLEGFKPGKIENLEVMDKWLLSKLMNVVKSSTESLDKYEYSRTKQETDIFFWQKFCDNYLEFVKHRVYGDDLDTKSKIAAQNTLYYALLTQLKLFAPIMPFITEEVYQMYFKGFEKKESIHITDWPEYKKSLVDEEAEKTGDLAVQIISEIRKHKSTQKQSLKVEIESLTINCTKEEKKLVELVLDDIKVVGVVKNINFKDSEELSISF